MCIRHTYVLGLGIIVIFFSNDNRIISDFDIVIIGIIIAHTVETHFSNHRRTLIFFAVSEIHYIQLHFHSTECTVSFY